MTKFEVTLRCKSGFSPFSFTVECATFAAAEEEGWQHEDEDYEIVKIEKDYEDEKIGD